MYLREKNFNKKAIYWQMDCMRLPLQVLGSMPVTDITRQHFAKIMEMQAQKDVKPASVRGRMSVLRTVLRWCASQGYMAMLDFPKLPAAHYEKFIPPTPEELSAIMAAAAPHIQRVIILGAQCGVRVGPSELLRLTWGDVDLDRQVLRVHGAKKNLSAPWREVPIRDALMPTFEAWKLEDEKQGIHHLIHHNGQPIAKIDEAWIRTLERAGITRRICPYYLRHAFATELIAVGSDIGTVAKSMGHNSPTMISNHYQYTMDGQKKVAVESLPDIQLCPNRKALTRQS